MKKILHSFYPISQTMAKCLTCKKDVKLNTGFHYKWKKEKVDKLDNYF